MGVDFYGEIGHAGWSWGGFFEFRTALAVHEGFDREAWRAIEQTTDPIFDTVTTPLMPLLRHSDCDGEISAEDCAQVADRLYEILHDVFPPGYDRIQGLRLTAIMYEKAKAGTPLRFQ